MKRIGWYAVRAFFAMEPERLCRGRSRACPFQEVATTRGQEMACNDWDPSEGLRQAQ